MTTIVEVAFDPVDRRFVCECTACGWAGRTTLLPTIAIVIGEHVRGCDGHRHKRTKTYDADHFADRLRSINDEPERQPHAGPPRGRPGEPREKLTEAAVREMRERFAAGAELRELAEAFGVTASNVHAIVRRKTWKHI